MKLVFTSCNEADAEALAEEMVNERFAACCNRFPGVESTYWWEGRLTTDAECLLLFKVADDRLDAMKAKLASIHPYELPEIVVLGVESALEAYAAWVSREGRPLPGAP